MNADLNKYKDFSRSNKFGINPMALNNKLTSITENETGVNLALLLTASIGMASEGGEFSEIVKKCNLGKTSDS